MKFVALIFGRAFFWMLCGGVIAPASFAQTVQPGVSSMQRGYSDFYEAVKKDPRAPQAEMLKKREQILGPKRVELGKAISQSVKTEVAKVKEHSKGSGTSFSPSKGGTQNLRPSAPTRPSEPETVIDGRDIPTMLVFPGSKPKATPEKKK